MFQINKFTTACLQLTDLKSITVGCKLIDQILGGGLKVAGGITELSGESGSGKTQLCLQVALMAQNSPTVGGIDKCKHIFFVFHHFETFFQAYFIIAIIFAIFRCRIRMYRR